MLLLINKGWNVDIIDIKLSHFDEKLIGQIIKLKK